MTDEESVEAIVIVRAEELARELPLVEPDWDAFEKRVKDALAAPPESEDALLVAPFPDLPPDTVDAPPAAENPAPSPVAAPPAAAEAAPSVREAPAPPAVPVETAASALDALADATESERAPGSLAELARAAVARRGDAQSSSIAKESLAIASQRRAQSDEGTAPVPEGTSRRAITLPPARRSPSGDVRTLWMGVGIAAVGLAAGFGLYLKGTSEPQTVIVAQGPAAPAGPLGQPAAPAQARGGAATPTPGGLMIDQSPRGVSLDQLEGEAPSKPVAPTSPGAAVAGGVAAGTPAASASPSPVRAERVVLEEDKGEAPAAGPAKPGPAPASAPLKPAELNRESGTGDRPSGGAAQAAVGAVLGAARSCIAGHPKPSSATLVFGSSGEVTSVSVGGPASGTPAAACIESALKKARVQPFAAPTFSLAVTVRPP